MNTTRISRIRRTAILPFFSALLAFAACVNITVNIPEGVVQQASDDYVGELFRAKEKRKETPTQAPKPKKATWNPDSLWITSAVAQDRLVKTDSPKALEIRDRQAARLDEIEAQKAAGVLGENNVGKLELKGKPAAGTEAKVKKLVDDENGDRTQLYEEILRQNAITKSHLSDIQKSFARSFQSHSPAKTWIQNEAGQWSQKP